MTNKELQMRLLTGLTLLSFSCLTFSKPVYLTCEYMADEKPMKVKVSLNESSGKIEHLMQNGRVISAEGIFTADLVKYSSSSMIGSAIVNTQEFEINRIDLTYTHSFLLMSTNPEVNAKVNPEPIIYKGLCNIGNH